MKFAQEAAEEIVTGGRLIGEAGPTEKAMIQHTQAIIETCYRESHPVVDTDTRTDSDTVKVLEAVKTDYEITHAKPDQFIAYRGLVAGLTRMKGGTNG